MKSISNDISTSVAKRLLLSHNIFTAGRYFFEIFLSIFIWKTTEDLSLVIYFNVLYLLLHTITFHVCAPIVKKGFVHVPRIIALLGFVLVYFAIFFLQENLIDYVLPIAAAFGFFNGMYWISYQVLRFNLTTRSNRGNYTGLEMGTKTFVSIIMPVLGGAIIAVNAFGSGYANLFLLGALLFICSLVVGNVYFPIVATSSFHLRKTFSLIWRNKDIRKSMYGYFFGSFSRGGTIIKLVLPIIIFDATGSELELGGWLSVFSVFAIASYFAFGKLVAYTNYKKWLLTSGIAYAVLLILIALFPSFWSYILFGALAQILAAGFMIPKRIIGENLIHTIPEEKNHMIEYIVIREWFNIGAGRLLSYLVLFLVGGLAAQQMSILLLLVALGIIVETALLFSVKTKL